MSRIRGKDTGPEMRVRRTAHALGYRFRLHRKDLPGKPDLVFPSRRKAILVHGCYWHRHDCPLGRREPKTRLDFWRRKFDSNVERDRRKIAQLMEAGWEVLVIWECQIQDPDQLVDRLIKYLEGDNG